MHNLHLILIKMFSRRRYSLLNVKQTLKTTAPVKEILVFTPLNRPHLSSWSAVLKGFDNTFTNLYLIY